MLYTNMCIIYMGNDSCPQYENILYIFESALIYFNIVKIVNRALMGNRHRLEKLYNTLLFCRNTKKIMLVIINMITDMVLKCFLFLKFSYIHLVVTANEKYTIATTLPAINATVYVDFNSNILNITNRTADMIVVIISAVLYFLLNKIFLRRIKENIVGINHGKEAPMVSRSNFSLPVI